MKPTILPLLDLHKKIIHDSTRGNKTEKDTLEGGKTVSKTDTYYTETTGRRRVITCTQN